MFKNYLKTAFRVFTRNKTFAAINVLGLSIGISAALVIFLIVQYEFGYDKIETDNNRIYRVVMDLKFNGNEGHSAAVPAPLSAAIQKEITGVEATVPIMLFQGDGTAKASIKRVGSSQPVAFKKQPGIVFTNPQYFSMLPYHWIAGTPGSSLKNPFNVVLTESRAKQYFPLTKNNDIIGKQINYNDDFTATVSGIVSDLDARTSFNGVEFISFATIAQTHMQDDFMMNTWNDWMAYSQVYVKLLKGTNPANTEALLAALLNKYNKDANKDAANTMHFHLQPLHDIHFNSLYAIFYQRLANKPTLYGLLAVAAFLLLLACINFINLTTANASQRAKEIGIRKTMGSSRKQLVMQFLGETFSLTVVACIVSFCLIPLLLKLFADFIPPGLQFQPLHQPYIFLFLLLLALLVSFLAGLYPALILSGYKPVNVLKNQSFRGSNETRHAWIRKTLTVSQFVIAQFFVIATMMVSKQISFSLNADMGFKKDAILNFNLPASKKDPAAKAKADVFMNKLHTIPGVVMASQGFLAPATEGAAFGKISYTDAKNVVKENVQVRWGDEHYLDVYQIKIIAGRNVTPVDSIHECLINEEYAKRLGFTNVAEAITNQLDWNNKKYIIVGIMHNFHEHSTHGLIDPVVFKYGSGDFMHVALQPDVNTWSKSIAEIQSTYKSLYPEEDFTYTFFDETIAKFYETEQHTASLLSWATGLSVLISCLGLLGLVMYTISIRKKEIGIRKVLGATVASIISVLSKDFVQLVLIAFVIAAPIAWWTSYKWLEDFAYKTSMSWWLFALSGLAMLVLALITLSIHTIRAAMANPVKSLSTDR